MKTIVIVFAIVGLVFGTAQAAIGEEFTLLELAEKKFSSLSAAEKKLFGKVAKGEIADCRSEKKENNDPGNAERWGDERVIRAKCLEWLCTKEALGFVTHKGIFLKGVRIDEEIGLMFVEISFPLVLQECAILGGIDLRHAKIRMLSLYGTHIGRIRADSLEVEGDVLLFKGFKAMGGVRLVGATIRGQLNCQNGEFVNPNGYALDASMLRVESSVFFRDGFKAVGEVRLVGATIGGQLDCDNGQFINPDGYALSADALKIEGGIFLRNGFRAEGQVEFRGAIIGGQMSCKKVQFINPDGYALSMDSLKIESSLLLHDGFKAKGGVRLAGASIGGQLNCNNGQFINPDGDAIIADKLKVTDNVFLSEGFEAEGKVRLHSTIIGGDLTCDGGQFINPKGEAFDGDSLKVEGNFFMRKGFRAEGEVYLVGATIGGQLACNGGHFINPNGKAINADSLKVDKHVYLHDGFKAEGRVDLVGAEIGGCFKWHKVDSPEQVTLDLRSTQIGILYDEPSSWPKKGKLLLNGLTYSDFFENCPKEAETRIEWIRRQYDPNNPKSQFHPQPYEQLATVLKKSGHDDDAKKVLIAKNKDRVKYGQELTFGEWGWYKFFGPMIGYGHRPLWVLYKGPFVNYKERFKVDGFVVRFLFSILFWISLGWICFGIGRLTKVITPTHVDTYIKKYKRISEDYHKFNFLVYSVDMFIPLVNLHQVEYWLPNVNRGTKNYKKLKYWSGFLRLYMWIHIVMGWVLTMLLVVGLTGLVAK